jgi:hypothetical protein
MNPNSSEAGPQFELPKTPKGIEKQREEAMESQVAQESKQTKQAPKTTQQTPVPAIPSAGPTAIPVKDAPSAPKTGAVSDSNLPAADADLIEKQWVSRAKAIVAQTQDDPYKQKKEMGKVKAEYIKKRFNKTIPSDDPVSA